MAAQLLCRYYGEHTVEQPLPDQFKDAYKLICGEREKLHHLPAWKAVDVAAYKPHIERWITENETLEGTPVEVFDPEYTPYIRAALYTAVAEKLTQAYYKLDEGDEDAALQLVDQLNEIVNTIIEKFILTGYQAEVTYTLDPDTRTYTAETKIYQST